MAIYILSPDVDCSAGDVSLNLPLVLGWFRHHSVVSWINQGEEGYVAGGIDP